MAAGFVARANRGGIERVLLSLRSCRRFLAPENRRNDLAAPPRRAADALVHARRHRETFAPVVRACSLL